MLVELSVYQITLPNKSAENLFNSSKKINDKNNGKTAVDGFH